MSLRTWRWAALRDCEEGLATTVNITALGSGHSPDGGHGHNRVIDRGMDVLEGTYIRSVAWLGEPYCSPEQQSHCDEKQDRNQELAPRATNRIHHDRRWRTGLVEREEGNYSRSKGGKVRGCSLGYGRVGARRCNSTLSLGRRRTAPSTHLMASFGTVA